MFIKAFEKRGTHVHVHDRKKYYPGEIYEVDDSLGKALIHNRVGEEIDPPKRGPGRPKKYDYSRV